MGRRERVELDDSGRPVLITDAETSFEDQHRARVRKYMLIMSVRIPALVLAAVAYAQWANPWISLAIIGVSIPLPWIAVLIANDRPPRSADEPRRYDYRRSASPESSQRALEGPVIDSESETDAADGSPDVEPGTDRSSPTGAGTEPTGPAPESSATADRDHPSGAATGTGEHRT